MIVVSAFVEISLEMVGEAVKLSVSTSDLAHDEAFGQVATTKS